MTHQMTLSRNELIEQILISRNMPFPVECDDGQQRLLVPGPNAWEICRYVYDLGLLSGFEAQHHDMEQTLEAWIRLRSDLDLAYSEQLCGEERELLFKQATNLRKKIKKEIERLEKEGSSDSDVDVLLTELHKAREELAHHDHRINWLVDKIINEETVFISKFLNDNIKKLGEKAKKRVSELPERIANCSRAIEQTSKSVAKIREQLGDDCSECIPYEIADSEQVLDGLFVLKQFTSRDLAADDANLAACLLQMFKREGPSTIDPLPAAVAAKALHDTGLLPANVATAKALFDAVKESGIATKNVREALTLWQAGNNEGILDQLSRDTVGTFHLALALSRLAIEKNLTLRQAKAALRSGAARRDRQNKERRKNPG